MGFILMQAAASYAAPTVAGFINGLGAGILLPTLVTWNMRELPLSRRGVGTGAFQSCLFFGMFANPVLVISLEKWLASPRAGALAVIGELLPAAVVVSTGAALLAGRAQR